MSLSAVKDNIADSDSTNLSKRINGRQPYNPNFGKANLPLKARLYGKKPGEALKEIGSTFVKFWSRPISRGRQLPLKEIVAYSGFGVGVSFLTSWIYSLATIVNIAYYYKVSSIHAYIIGLLAALLNFAVQPILARMFEKTNTKYGKYKPYMLAVLPAAGIFTILISLMPEFKDGGMRVLYVYLTFVPVIVINNFIMFMYQTFPTVITSHQQERIDIMSPIQLIFGAAPSILQVIRGPLRTFCAKYLGSELWEARIVGFISTILGVLFMLLIIRVRERVFVVKAEKQAKMDFKTTMKSLFANKPLIIFSLALTVGSLKVIPLEFLGIILQTKLAPTVKLALDLSGLPLTIIGFGVTVAMIMLPILSRLMSKRLILVIFTGLMALSYGTLGIVGLHRIPDGTPSAVIITLAFFLARITPEILLIPIMLGDICDYQQSISGRRYEGHVQNFLLTMPIFIVSIGRLVMYPLQKAVGYEPYDYQLPKNLSAEALKAFKYSQAQIDTANNWFRLVFIIGAASAALMAIVMIFYPLSKKLHAEAMEKIKGDSIDFKEIPGRRAVVDKRPAFVKIEYNNLKMLKKMKRELASTREYGKVSNLMNKVKRQSLYMNGMNNVTNANKTLRQLETAKRSMNLKTGASNIRSMKKQIEIMLTA